MTAPKTVIITGANRGIGLQLATVLGEAGNKIIGTARNPDAATKLKQVKGLAGIVRAEMSDLDSISRIAEDINKLAPEGIDELWNNAGQALNHGVLSKIDLKGFAKELAANVVAPSGITRALLPALRKRSTKKVIFLSSIMGSQTFASSFIEDVVAGRPLIESEDVSTEITYCTTKSALTMQAIGWYSELKNEGFTVIPLHPGWIRTDMTSPNAPLTLEEAIPILIKTVENRSPKDTIKLVNYNGGTLPW